MIVKLDGAVGPLKLVALIANRKIEIPAANRGGMRHQIPQMRGARPPAGDIAFIITGDDMIEAVVEDEPEIDRSRIYPDIKPADVNHMLRCGIKREIGQEVAIVRTGKNIGNTHAGQGSALLKKQNVEAVGAFVATLGADKADFADLFEPSALGTIFLASR